jgi:hypothetical protein
VESLEILESNAVEIRPERVPFPTTYLDFFEDLTPGRHSHLVVCGLCGRRLNFTSHDSSAIRSFYSF